MTTWLAVFVTIFAHDPARFSPNDVDNCPASLQFNNSIRIDEMPGFLLVGVTVTGVEATLANPELFIAVTVH